MVTTYVYHACLLYMHFHVCTCMQANRFIATTTTHSSATTILQRTCIQKHVYSNIELLQYRYRFSPIPRIADDWTADTYYAAKYDTDYERSIISRYFQREFL